MNLMGIASYLDTQDIGRMGESIFVTEMPMECKEGVLLLDRYAGSTIDHELPGWRDTGFRFVVRSANYTQGMALATRASQTLTVRSDTEMGSVADASHMLMRLMLPMNDPLPYRRSVAGVWEFEVDVECVYIIG